MVYFSFFFKATHYSQHEPVQSRIKNNKTYFNLSLCSEWCYFRTDHVNRRGKEAVLEKQFGRKTDEQKPLGRAALG